MGSSGAASTITGNTISSINATTAGAINVSVAAMVTANTAAGGTITKNRIYGLTNSKSGALANTIGFVPNGGNWTFANNMIQSLTTIRFVLLEFLMPVQLALETTIITVFILAEPMQEHKFLMHFNIMPLQVQLQTLRIIFL